VVHDGDGGKTVLETGRDITERKSTELEIRRLNEELRARVSELTAVNLELDSFNYSISHDLRAPLRHIDAYTKILLDRADIDLPEDARNDLQRVRRGASRMGRMVDELLELSRTSRKEPARQATELNSLVEDVLVELKPELQDREIEWRIAELPVVDCDPTLTRQVFANLLGNAVKFTRHRKPAVIEVGHVLSEGQTVLFVRDNGVGFSMKYADKLFGVLQRLHRREDFEGTGVGLATVQRIIHKHGGRVWPEAELDKGATFYFTLEPPRQPPPGQPAVTPPALFAGEK
jgi:light-regulated signal transduction histidine kinase (bacteriophytochrome)